MTVDLTWAIGLLVDAQLISEVAQRVRVRHAPETIEIDLEAGAAYTLTFAAG